MGRLAGCRLLAAQPPLGGCLSVAGAGWVDGIGTETDGYRDWEGFEGTETTGTRDSRGTAGSVGTPGHGTILTHGDSGTVGTTAVVRSSRTTSTNKSDQHSLKAPRRWRSLSDISRKPRAIGVAAPTTASASGVPLSVPPDSTVRRRRRARFSRTVLNEEPAWPALPRRNEHVAAESLAYDGRPPIRRRLTRVSLGGIDALPPTLATLCCSSVHGHVALSQHRPSAIPGFRHPALAWPRGMLAQLRPHKISPARRDVTHALVFIYYSGTKRENLNTAQIPLKCPNIALEAKLFNHSL